MSFIKFLFFIFICVFLNAQTYITVPNKSTGSKLSAAEFNQLIQALKNGTRSIKTEGIQIGSRYYTTFLIPDEFADSLANSVDSNTLEVKVNSKIGVTSDFRTYTDIVNMKTNADTSTLGAYCFTKNSLNKQDGGLWVLLESDSIDVLYRNDDAISAQAKSGKRSWIRLEALEGIVRPEWYGAVPTISTTYNGINSTQAVQDALNIKRLNVYLKKQIYWVDSLIVRQGTWLIGQKHSSGVSSGTNIRPVPGSTAKALIYSGDLSAYGDDQNMHGSGLEDIYINGNSMAVAGQIGIYWGGNGYQNGLKNITVGGFDSIGVEFNSSTVEVMGITDLFVSSNGYCGLKIRGAGAYHFKGFTKIDVSNGEKAVLTTGSPGARSRAIIFDNLRIETWGAGGSNNGIEIETSSHHYFGFVGAYATSGTPSSGSLFYINTSYPSLHVSYAQLGTGASSTTYSNMLVDANKYLTVPGLNMSDFWLEYNLSGTYATQNQHRIYNYNYPSVLSLGRNANIASGAELGRIDFRVANSESDTVIALIVAKMSSAGAFNHGSLELWLKGFYGYRKMMELERLANDVVFPYGIKLSAGGAPIDSSAVVNNQVMQLFDTNDYGYGAMRYLVGYQYYPTTADSIRWIFANPTAATKDTTEWIGLH